MTPEEEVNRDSMWKGSYCTVARQRPALVVLAVTGVELEQYFPAG